MSAATTNLTRTLRDLVSFRGRWSQAPVTRTGTNAASVPFQRYFQLRAESLLRAGSET